MKLVQEDVAALKEERIGLLRFVRQLESDMLKGKVHRPVIFPTC
jgi:hypothetical protein